MRSATKAALSALDDIRLELARLNDGQPVGAMTQPTASEEAMRTETKSALAALEQLAPALREHIDLERLDAILRTVAFFERTIGYGEIGKLLGVFSGSPKFTGLLAERMREDHAARGPLYCALICSKAGGNRPSQGFFDQALSLGYVFADSDTFWAEQRDACFAAAK